MQSRTAAQNKIPLLYHWQKFEPARFEQQLRDGTVYCSKPNDFNDPWDCRPFFNTDLLADPDERRKHIDWAVEICKRDGRMSAEDMEGMRRKLQDPAVLERYVSEHIIATQKAVIDRYRVYCLGPDVNNLLMWAHYADRHRGICLEFNVKNLTMCSAQEVQYFPQFPMTRQYSKDLGENALPLLAKGDHWKYEQEYRLIAQEKDNSTNHDTLVCENGHLKLEKGALVSVIVGNDGLYQQVCEIVAKHAPHVRIRRARLVPNKYKLDIEP